MKSGSHIQDPGKRLTMPFVWCKNYSFTKRQVIALLLDSIYTNWWLINFHANCFFLASGRRFKALGYLSRTRAKMLLYPYFVYRFMSTVYKRIIPSISFILAPAKTNHDSAEIRQICWTEPELPDLTIFSACQASSREASTHEGASH